MGAHLVFGSGCGSGCRSEAAPLPDSGPADSDRPAIPRAGIYDWLPDTSWHCEWHAWSEEYSDPPITEAKVAHRWEFTEQTYTTDLVNRIVEAWERGEITASHVQMSWVADMIDNRAQAVEHLQDRKWHGFGDDRVMAELCFRDETSACVATEWMVERTSDGSILIDRPYDKWNIIVCVPE